MHVNLEKLADAQSIADNLALLPKEALLYIAGYAEGRRDRPAQKRRKKSTNGEKEAHPWRGGMEREGTMEIIIKGCTKEIADLVLALQGQRNQDACFQTDIYGKQYSPLDTIRQAVRQAIDGIAEAKPET